MTYQVKKPIALAGQGLQAKNNPIQSKQLTAMCSDWIGSFSPSWKHIRPGDLVRYDTETSGHVVVVVKKTDDLLFFTDSGLSNKVYWGGNVPRWWMESQSGYILYT